MKCPECGKWTFVRETRQRLDGTKRRRYECANGHRFTTEEKALHKPDSVIQFQTSTTGGNYEQAHTGTLDAS